MDTDFFYNLALCLIPAGAFWASHAIETRVKRDGGAARR